MKEIRQIPGDFLLLKYSREILSFTKLVLQKNSDEGIII